MEPLLSSPSKCSVAKARVLAVLLSLVLCTAILCLLQLRSIKPKIKTDFYSFQVKDSKGRTVALEKFRGKEATLVVNVASNCQYTERNYLALQELHREFGPSHFSVLAFPCSQFGDSEPGPSQEIEAFAKGNYGATFPIFHKIKILGSEAEPAFRYLIDSSKKEPRWNFWKYLVNPEGKVVKFWRPEEPFEIIKPDIAALVRQIIMKKKEDL
ncbi:probable glutathione peroxidase 8 isoform X1 [Ornithorhynchus anatinus]|uniref:probable glutathione peroxidase 8 isoform X1 n=1 Tax=Ornithorhynchus anatinus TaxID=9258 RepID=UPI0007AA78AE|nr:probable glutathione peroxidase 8 isoform X1 [Ornithorhynchus anatinus]